MRRIFTIAYLLAFPIAAWSQFIPNNGQSFQFMPIYNPAFAGIENFHDFKVSYRYQWTGFGSDAPKFMNLAYTLRVKQPLDLNYNGLRSSYSKSLDPSEFPRMKTSIAGLGISVFSEQFGPVKRTGGGLHYGFHYALSRNLRVALGVGVMFESQKVGINQITVRDNDEYYNQLLKDGSTQTAISARAGILFYSKWFYAGFSYLPVYNHIIQASTVTPQNPFYKASAQIGFSAELTAELTLKPSALALLQVDGKLQIDYNLKAYIQQRVWLGVSYRDVESVIPMAGFQISDVLSASYSYELSTSGFKQFSDSSHELVLSVRLNNFKHLKQYTW